MKEVKFEACFFTQVSRCMDELPGKVVKADTTAMFKKHVDRRCAALFHVLTGVSVQSSKSLKEIKILNSNLKFIK